MTLSVNRWTVIGGLAIGAVVFYAINRRGAFDPDAQLAPFYAAPEAEAIGILVKEGPGIVPAVCLRMKDPAMPRRQLAVRALGKIRQKQAATDLAELAVSRDEPGELRMEALRSLLCVDPAVARHMAREMREDEGEIGEYARTLLGTDGGPPDAP